MTIEYYLTTGAKFEGTEEEFETTKPFCLGKACPMTDEDGYFSKWYCTIDWEFCDHQCQNHKKPRKLNPDIAEFFQATCERYRQND